MGQDFLSKTAKSFHKGLDQSRVELGTPDLFTHQPECEPRAYAASIPSKKTLSAGENLSVCFLKNNIVARRGMDIVAEFDSPPAELIEALTKSFGEACGTVIVVHDIANTAEISVC